VKAITFPTSLGPYLTPALLVLALMANAGVAGATAQGGGARLYVLRGASLDGWREKVFAGHTRYRSLHTDDGVVLQARSHGTASSLYRPMRIDLKHTPIMHWRWRVAGVLGDIDETRRRGDDFAARIYAIVARPIWAWKTRAICYVWASRKPRGATWPNPYTGNSRMFALRSGSTDAARWVTERRDVRADLRRLLGEDLRYLDGVAIMTDSDDTGGVATAYYGDIWFTAE